MKKILLLAICMGIISLNVYANVVFYNEGAIVATGNNTNETSIYINGDMLITDNAASISQIELQKTRVKLIGDFINNLTPGLAGGNGFISSSSLEDGVFEFCGELQQKIKTLGTTITNSPSKLYNFINFPHLDINNNKHIIIDPRLAVKTKNIELTKGWLIVDSAIAEPLIDGGNEVNSDQESVLAHLLVDGTINYNSSTWQGKDINDRGFIQVNLTVPNEGTRNEKSIIGFGSPFKELRADYFMYNTLLEPLPAGFLSKPAITDPEAVLPAGKGYVVGIDLKGTDEANYVPIEEWEGIIDFSQRSVGNYRFNRSNFSVYAPSNQVFGSDATVNAYQNETLNTENVSVTLSEGFNYLSNPYTTPLNIDKLLGDDEAASTWGINAADLSTKPQVRNRVWILAPNSMAEPTTTLHKSKYTYNYQVAMRTGGTYIDNDNIAGVTSIAPLQMFLIRAYPTAVEAIITIPKSERVMGTTRFMRNAPVVKPRRDDFILEFRDMTTRTTDRLSYVLRTKDELASQPAEYNNVDRLVSTSSEGSDGTRAMAVSSDFEQSLASQIYTKNSSGKPLTVQFLPIEGTSSIQLYHIPSSIAQPIQILGLRINSRDKVSRMWLEDRLKKVTTEITPEMLYETYSNPSDPIDRFVIRFTNDELSIDDSENDQRKVFAYQQDQNIIVDGFTHNDIGNIVELYDINGRILVQKQIDQSRISLYEASISGVYFVKITGEQPQTIKLLVK